MTSSFTKSSYSVAGRWIDNDSNGVVGSWIDCNGITGGAGYWPSFAFASHWKMEWKENVKKWEIETYFHGIVVLYNMLIN